MGSPPSNPNQVLSSPSYNSNYILNDKHFCKNLSSHWSRIPRKENPRENVGQIPAHTLFLLKKFTLLCCLLPHASATSNLQKRANHNPLSRPPASQHMPSPQSGSRRLLSAHRGDPTSKEKSAFQENEGKSCLFPRAASILLPSQSRERRWEC